VEAETRLRSLEDADGASGVTQRAAKAGLQRAGGRSGADTYGRGASTPASRPAGGGGGGFGGGLRGPAVANAPADRAKEAAPETVRNVAQKTFYRRANRWIDSVVTEELEKQARKVVQFSDEYFALADRHGKALSQYLVFDEPVLIALDGETLLIEPSEN